MKTLTVILGISLHVGLPEIIIFLLAAMLLGFSIHFYWAGRNSPSLGSEEETRNASGISVTDEWRLQFYEQIEQHEKNNEGLKEEVAEARAREKLLIRKCEDLESELSLMEIELEDKKERKESDSSDYLTELVHAQQNLQDHNHQIARLLEQLDQLKAAENKNIEVLKSNESLSAEIRELRHALFTKESEIKNIRQRELLSKEMNERLENAYEGFKTIQEKLHKLEGYVADPQSGNFDYEELQQSYFRITKEYDEIKLRNISLMEERQQLNRNLADSEEKLREANFQKQRLSKKVAYLEELTIDLQQVTGQNKKLEAQLKRINEIEDMLSKVSAENRK